METKKCYTCKEVKLVSEFYKNNKYFDGLHYVCKDCERVRKSKQKGSEVKVRHPCKVEKFCTSTEKQCCQCLQVKDHKNFSRLKSSKDGRAHQCKACCKEIRDRTSHTVIKRHSNNMACVKHHYGLTENKLQDMLLEQQGCCVICNVDFGLKLVANKGRQYHIDHSHDTGKVRGLICTSCNTYVGALEARNAIAYPANIKEYLSRGL